LAEWPTPIVFSGFEIGDAIKTGPQLAVRTPEDNPVRIAYTLWHSYYWELWDKTYQPGTIRPHPSYDQTAVLYAARGAQNY
jgi:hypothetical protein